MPGWAKRRAVITRLEARIDWLEQAGPTPTSGPAVAAQKAEWLGRLEAAV